MKKTYRTPAILTVKMRHRTHLLAGSGESSKSFSGEISGYDSNDKEEEEEEVSYIR